MRRSFLVILVTAVMAVATLQSGQAAAFPNSLWIGTDNTGSRPILNTDRLGNELRRVDNVEATGFAIDLAGNTIYFGTSGGVITPRDLDTLTPGTPVGINPPSWSEDMTFDGSRIWGTDNGASVKRINPATGDVEFSFDAGLSGTMGVAWDGSHLWVSEYNTYGRIRRFTTLGEFTGEGFVFDSIALGGLAFDTSDNTLWIGTWGRVYHYSTGGLQLGFFDVPVNDGRFVDGLEFEQPVPEPSTLLALGFSLTGIVGFGRKRSRKH